MSRRLIPGAWNHDGVAVRIDTHRVHLLDDSELVNDIAPDADRCIKPPVRTPEDDAYIAKVRRWSVVIALAAAALLATLLKLAGSRSFE